MADGWRPAAVRERCSGDGDRMEVALVVGGNVDGALVRGRVNHECDRGDSRSRNRGAARRWCCSFRAMTWSSISRRQLPTHLPAVPFSQGAWMFVRLGFRPVAFKNDGLIVELRVSIQDHVTKMGRPRERLRAAAGPPSPRSGRVTLQCRILRRPCSMTKKQ